MERPNHWKCIIPWNKLVKECMHEKSQAHEHSLGDCRDYVWKNYKDLFLTLFRIKQINGVTIHHSASTCGIITIA